MIEKQVLIVMDDSEISQSIHMCLKRSAIEADCVDTLSKALEYVIKRSYCLLIIDLQMAHIGNAELVRVFRAAKHTPILALSESLEAQEELELFHIGVDVFLEKPVNADICATQASALIRLHSETNDELKKPSAIAFGSSMIITPRYRQVLVQGTPVELTRLEFDLLYFMAKHPRQVFSRRELYDYVWNDSYEVAGDEAVKSHIKALRKKFSGLGRDIIETVWGVGYRFIPPE